MLALNDIKLNIAEQELVSKQAILIKDKKRDPSPEKLLGHNLNGPQVDA